MALNKLVKKLNLENEVEEVITEKPATIENIVEQDITNSEFKETSKDLEEAIETSDELDEVGSEVQEELDAVNERLKSEEPIDSVDVTVVNESIQHYSKLLGLTRESVNLSLEDVRNNSRESMEGLKVELEGIGENIKTFGKKVWAKIQELFGKLLKLIKGIIPSRKARTMKILNDTKEATGKSEEAKEKYDYRVQTIINELQSNDLIKAANENDLSASQVANIAFLTLFKMFGARLEKLPAYLDGVKLFIQENKKALEKRDPQLDSIEISSLLNVNNAVLDNIRFTTDSNINKNYLKNVVLSLPGRRNNIMLITKLVGTKIDSEGNKYSTLVSFDGQLDLKPVKVDESFFKLENLISLYKTFYSKIDAVDDAVLDYKYALDKLVNDNTREEYDITVFKHNTQIVYSVVKRILGELRIIMEDFVDDFRIAAAASGGAMAMAKSANSIAEK